MGRKSGVVIDPESGLCLFHKQRGIDAAPPKANLLGPIGGSSVREIAERIEHRANSRHEGGGHIAASQQPVKGKQLPVDTVASVDCAKVRPLQNQPRTHFSKSELHGLEESIKEIGQIQAVPAVSLPDGTFRIRDGERRWRACKKLGRKLRIIVVPELPHEQEVEQAAYANFNRSNHTPIEMARTFKALRDGSLKRPVKYIAACTGVTEVTIYNYLALIEKTHPKVQELLDPAIQGGKKNVLGHTIALELSIFYEHHSDLQITLAHEIHRKKLNIRDARNLIKRHADRLNITSGRGREAMPADHIRTIKRMLSYNESILERFAGFSEQDWDRFWSTRSWQEKEDLLARLENLGKQFEEIRKHVRRTLSGNVTPIRR